MIGEVRYCVLEAIILFLLWNLCSPAPSQEKPEHQRLGRGDLATTLEIFNLWGEQPAAKQEVIRIAHSFLQARPKGTIAELVEQPEFQRACREAGLTHLGGPMLGCLTSDGVSVWVRTLGQAEVSVQVTINGEVRRFGPVTSTRETDFTAVVPVTGLPRGVVLSYRLLIDGQPVPIPENAAIHTLPEEGKPVRIAFGSCMHRWGVGNPRLSAEIRERQPAVLLLIGDTAAQDRDNHLGLHRLDYLVRDLTAAWQQLVAEVPVYVTWDDHDYFNNDKWGLPKGFSEEDRQGVWEVFRQCWNNPAYGLGPGRGGVFLQTRIGPCDVIMTDNRYFREKGNFLGTEQMAWLKERLLAAKGPFVILSCGTMWSDYVSAGKDSWGVFDPQGREELFRFIEEHHIGGVLLISGDRHGARGFRIPRPNGRDFYEFEGASLGGRSGPPVRQPDWTTQLYGMSGEYAFSEFEFDVSGPDPKVTFRLFLLDGKTFYETTLGQEQLSR
jgi:alkaline phosphatase D